MDVSILIPIRVTRQEFMCYLDNLKFCLEAVRRQTYRDFECIIIDYGSIDPVKKKIKNYVKKYAFEYIRGEGTIWSRSKSLNIGIHAAKGNIILFVDADCVMQANYVYQNLIYINSDTHIFTSNAVYDTRKNLIKSADTTRLKKFCYKNPRPGGISHMGIRKSWLLQNSGFNEAYKGWGGEDNDLWFRLRKTGNTPKYTKTAAYHLWHPSYEELMRQIGAHALFKKLRNQNRKRYAELKLGITK
jgi:glycosyltransferase involved in cell wall biosynthesis